MPDLSRKPWPIPLTADGGLVKLLVTTGDPCKPPPKWEKSTKAVFHYKVFTIPYEQKQDAENWFKHGLALVDLDSEQVADSDVQDLGRSESGKAVNLNRHPSRVDPNRRTLIGDSKRWDKRPFELRIGKGFSVEAMEVAVKTMRIGEVSRFFCLPKYAEPYIQLESVLRKQRKKMYSGSKGVDVPVSICCGGQVHEEQDLYDLISCPMEMRIHLIDVLAPNSYEKDLWEKTVVEKHEGAQVSKQLGDKLYRQGEFKKAAEQFQKAVQHYQSLLISPTIADLEEKRRALKRDPLSEEALQDVGLTSEEERSLHQEDIHQAWIKSVMNLAACYMKLERFQEVVSICTTIIQVDGRTAKAYYRRGQALARIGKDLDGAMADLKQAQSLCSEIDKNISLEMDNLGKKIANSNRQESTLFKGLFP